MINTNDNNNDNNFYRIMAYIFSGLFCIVKVVSLLLPGKPGQYLDHKNCVCKNKLVGRLISECTTIINETMINTNG